MRHFAAIAITIVIAWGSSLTPGTSASAELSPLPDKLPGLWVEMEAGDGHSRVQDMREASGGKLLSNFNPGSTVTLTFDVPEPMVSARLYVRYNNAMKTEGHLAAAVASGDGASRPAGELVMTHSPQWNQFRWTSLPLGKLAEGTHRVTLSVPKDKASGGLDVAVILDDRWDGRYEPPTQFKNGKPEGLGRVLPKVELTATPGAKFGEFGINEAVSFSLALSNRTTSAISDPLQWQIEDHSGKVIEQGNIPVNLKPRQELVVDRQLSDGLSEGWYRVRFTHAQAIAGQANFVSLPATTPRKIEPGAFTGQWLGMNRGRGPLQPVIDDFKAIGLRATRNGANHADPAVSEADITAMLDAGLQIHWVINYRGNGVDPTGTSVALLSQLDLNGPVMKQWYDNYKARCIAYMRHYSAPGEERILYYITGNEPDKRDNHTGLPNRPDVAARLVRAMAEAAREVNPRIIVQSSPVAQPDTDYLRRMIVDHRVQDHCDVIGTHVYGNQTLNHRLGKPWEYLREAGGPMIPVACTEAGVSTGWTPKGGDGRQWQTDFMAHWYIKTKRMGYAYGILFTHDDDHTPDWAKMRVGDQRLQPNWDYIEQVLTQPRAFANGGFEDTNDVRSGWVPDRNLDIPGWMDDRLNFQATDEVRTGKFAARINQGGYEHHLAAYQLVEQGIEPGKPVTVSGYIKTTGGSASLSVNGFNRLNGDETRRERVDATEWTPVEITVTPTNPWIVIGIESHPADAAEAFAWFDDITVVTAP